MLLAYSPIHLEVIILYLSFTLPLISVLYLNSVLIYLSEKLYVLNVLHPVYFCMYTRFHILSDQKARDL